MRILGLLFIVAGSLLCLTFVFIGIGAPLVGVGALLVIASKYDTPGRFYKPLLVVFWTLVGFLVLSSAGWWYLGVRARAAAEQQTPAAHSTTPAVAPKHVKHVKK